MFIKLSTLQCPLYEGDIRLEYPEISDDLTGPTFPCPDTYAPVRSLRAPEYNPDTHYITQEAPILVGSGWVRGWTIVELSEQQKAEIADRNRKIAENEANQWTKIALNNPVE